MNVLFINATYGIGSTGRIVSNLCSFFENNGHNCYVACQKSNIKSNNIFIIGNKMDWKIHALKSRLFGDQAFHSTLPTSKIKRILRTKKIDIVNVHNVHSNFVNFHTLMKILKKANIPVVFTLHDCWFFTGKCFHYIDAGCDKYKSVCSNCPKLHYAPNSFFFDRSKQLQARKRKDYIGLEKLYVVACSDWIASEAKQSILSCAKNILTIHNGVDTKAFRFKPINLGKSNKIRILGMANKFRLPQNANILKKLISDDLFDITICGCLKNDFDYFSLFSNSLNLLPVQNSSSELANIYSNADVFLNLTFADTFPTVNLESICCGTPVVAFNRGGASEIITSSCGKVVEHDNYEYLKTCIIDASKIDKSACSKYGLESFDEVKSYKKYMDYFEEILGNEK